MIDINDIVMFKMFKLKKKQIKGKWMVIESTEDMRRILKEVAKEAIRNYKEDPRSWNT